MKKPSYKNARTCIYNVNYHLIWCVKYRRKVLSEEISSRLYVLLQDIASEKGFEIVEAKVDEGDHIHVFVSAHPKLSISNIARWLKGISGRHLLMEFPELREKLWKGHLWNDSYFVETIGSTSQENIKAYIRRQKTCQM
ncbi:IS200/IS605 family transposase [Faecalibaculum rodentium]|uniref:IS200/IS605 family transposase n=1 Tax=Faecalibaculum rodentium TaxID=1702221 RepID=UPI0023F04FC8|nr:IS200/IS605 family transposase [Faecalibaculum rodentium]